MRKGKLSDHEAGMMPVKERQREGRRVGSRKVRKAVDCYVVLRKAIDYWVALRTFQQGQEGALEPKLSIREAPVPREWASLVFLPCSVIGWERPIEIVTLLLIYQ